MLELSPVQIRGLKLAKDGDLFPAEGNSWTHLNAQVTYARTDRFKERPQKIKSIKTTTVNELREHGLLQPVNPDTSVEQSAHGITMAGKMWLLQNK